MDYSKYKCPYSHIEKECGHELKGPEGYQDVYSVWCPCGYHGPVFCLDPNELGLEFKYNEQKEQTCLTCEFEPEWKKHFVKTFGFCRWGQHIPAGISVEFKYTVILKCSPCKNCPAWRPKSGE